MIRIALLFARCRSLMSSKPRPEFTLVKTEVEDDLELHGGDMLAIERNPRGDYVLGAYRLYSYDFDFYPIAFCGEDAEARELKHNLTLAIERGARRFDARTPAHKRSLEQLRREETQEGAAA